MNTEVSAHLLVLANENGGGFNVQPGQQQAGGKVEVNLIQRPHHDEYSNKLWIPTAHRAEPQLNANRERCSNGGPGMQ